ncbi:uncharacterized protein LOC17900115 [Capsella rubella]|nr:uncharacterized protein LOC17900115 [Capsella rubella]
MATPEEVEYEKFLERVRRTVYIDELTPLATYPVIEAAFNQFGTVKSVSFIPNFLGPKELPIGVLVEMETEEMAKDVTATVTQLPFMVAGMPRPVRATPSHPHMFVDRPKKPGRKIRFRWINPNDPDFDKAKKMKRLVRKHTAETSFMLKKQLEEADKLSKQQAETAITHHKKFEMCDKLLHDGVAQKLADCYNIKSYPYR